MLNPLKGLLGSAFATHLEAFVNAYKDGQLSIVPATAASNCTRLHG